MLQELTWDTAMIGRKIGVLKYPTADAGALDEDIARARDEAFQYLTVKLNVHDNAMIQRLGDRSFRLIDQGVTWAIFSEKYQCPKDVTPTLSSVEAARKEHIAGLQSLMPSLFVESRFYNDPFFSIEEADRLHREWIRNSVEGNAADVVLFLVGAGFITCKVSGDTGDVILVGVRKEARGQGLGLTLMAAAMNWFRDHHVRFVRVRTQLRNFPAMNFYRRQGFVIHDADVTFGLVLRLPSN